MSDGKVLATLSTIAATNAQTPLLRLDALGNLDETFGIRGYAHCQGAPCPSNGFGMLATTQDGSIVVSGRIRAPTKDVLTALRFTPDGALDLAFGQGGQAEAPAAALGAEGGQALVVDSRNRIVMGGSILTDDPVRPRVPSIVRWLADGSVDATFGDNGRTTLAVNATVVSVAAAGDKLIVILSSDGRSWLVARLDEHGRPDTTFGTGGIASIPQYSISELQGGAVQEDGGIVVVGAERIVAWDAFQAQTVVGRLASDGTLDTTFGISGYVRPHAGRTSLAVSVAIQADGKIVTASRGSLPSSLFVTRLNSNGAPDITFAGAGTSTIPSVKSFFTGAVRIDGSGAIYVPGAFHVRSILPSGSIISTPVWSPVIFKFKGGAGLVIRPWWETVAVEYFSENLGHYFVTSYLQEMSALDSQATPGWTRTGRTFKVWEEGDGTLPMCRFWSGQRFAPKSSHFYTPYPAECASLRAGTDWQYEGDAFRAKLPVGDTLGARDCDSNSQPLYRAYNNGLTGAPNHRYTTDLAVLNEMISKSWSFEGEAQTKVFACGPVQD